MPEHHHERRSSSSLLAIAAVSCLLAVTATLASAATAFAGVWMHVSCVNPDQSAAPSEGWAGGFTGSPSIGSTNNANCGPGSPMGAGLSTRAAVFTGAAAYLVYTPPASSTLVGGSLLAALSATGYGYQAVGTAAAFTPAYAYDASNVFFQCVAVFIACQNGTTEFYGVLDVPPNRGGKLYLAAACTGVAGRSCSLGGAHGGWSAIGIGYSNLLLSSASLPTASDFRGSLLAQGAHGLASLAFTAADSGPGILRAIVTIDDKIVYEGTPNTNAGKCRSVGTDPASGALMFDYQQPCPQSQTVDLQIRTTNLADAEHELKITLLNAAQNSSTVLRQTISTDNRATVSSTLTSDPASADAGTPPPVYAIELDKATQALVKGVRRSWARSALTLRGTLRNSSGVAAPGVPVSLLAQNADQGAPGVAARTVSNAAGHWELKAPRGPSRTLTVTYGDRPQAVAAQGAVTIRQAVTPGLTLRVQPTGRGRLRFTGRLSIKPLGSPRPLVVIQARKGKRWQAVGSAVRVKANGAYALTYNGGRGVVGGRFTFRAVAPATRLFRTATSPTRKTVVR